MRRTLILPFAAWVAVPACTDDQVPGAGERSVRARRHGTCAENWRFTCSDEALWPESDLPFFGDDDHHVDAEGCMRRLCKTDADCLGSETCYRPTCFPSTLLCHDERADNGETLCLCDQTDDCGGAYCKHNAD